MAIARDGVAASTGKVTGFTLTIPHDCGNGADRFLVVALYAHVDDITSVAYNAVPCTLLKKTGNGKLQMWGLADPQGGTNNLTVSNSGFHFMSAAVKCYTGVDEPTTPDSTSASTDNATFVTSLTMSTTTSADNSWAFYAVHCSSLVSVAVAGTNSNLVGQLLDTTYGSVNLFDSNAAISPAAARSMQATHGSSVNWLGVELSLAPEGTPGGGGSTISNYGVLLLCG